MTKIRGIILILAALTMSAVLPACAWNVGDPISSVEDLTSFRDAVNEGNSFAGKTVVLSDDITLSGEWTPIGTDEHPFSGKFNGGGHEIIGLNITTDTMRDLTVSGIKGKGGGLFLNIAGEGAQIANLTVTGTIDSSPAADTSVVGGIAARLGPGAVIYRCLSNVDVRLDGNKKETERDTYSYAGGIVGYSEGYVIYCVNEGAVEAEPQRTFTSAGGVAGSQHGGSVLFSDNSGEITVPDAGSYNRAYAGGIAGSVVDGSISSVRNQGAVTSYNLAGGVTAYAMNSVLRDAVNTAQVDAIWNGRDVTAGGIVAQLYNGSSAVNCYNTGNVTAGGGANDAYAGGIAGWCSAGFYASNKIYNCTNSGSVSGNASNSARVGGLVGDINKTELYSSVSSGSTSANSPHVAGGIAGYKYPTSEIHDVAYSGALSAIGYGDRNASHVQNLSSSEIDSFTATAFPSLDPPIVSVPQGGSANVNIKLATHPGTPSDVSAYYSIDGVYTDPAEIAEAEAAGGSISVIGMSPGVTLLAAYVETYRSGPNGGVDRTSPSRSLVSALVWIPEDGGGAGDGGVPPLWPDGVLPPEVPGEPETGMGWDERFPRHSCSGGCNAGWGALAMLALVPLAFMRRR